MAKSAKTKEMEELKSLAVPEDAKDFSDLILTPEQAQFLAAYVNNGFKVVIAAQVCRIRLNQFYEWKAQYPHFAKAIEMCRDRFVDKIEDAFKDLIDERNPQAVLFGLRTLGKERGYGENLRVENDVKISGIEIEVIPSRKALEAKDESKVPNQ